ncbi:putative transcriptional regulator YheO [Mesorhizobium robiniae]|uniref:Transcriptional regulator YheO n=1 Tax=Mesorhizobium robiniae TaxID=559315 RepID=A0ABV2H0C1_9HYPH|nr:helix-turn-helix domain-containing protein [Mesorhizobium sp. ZC-5]MCV3244141.1 helix-turn-helix domain-containing protein [Mesorhizobium sp. ZC-5]
MTSKPRPPNDEDKPIHHDEQRVNDFLKMLAQLVPQIARSIMYDCEVVLHDNRVSPPRILAIGNGHVTRRGVGDLMTRIAIGEHDLTNLQEPLFNYGSIAPDGRPIRVSLLPIIIDGRTVAYLAINFATGDLLMAQRIIGLLTRIEPHPTQIKETFLPSSLSLEQLIDSYLEDFARPPHLLDRVDRIELVRRLHDQGVFQMRGIVREIAGRLGISRAAVYNYLKVATEDAAS